MESKFYFMNFMRSCVLFVMLTFSVGLCVAANLTKPIIDPDPCANDKIAPSFHCPSDIVVTAGCNEKCAPVTFKLPTALDNCDKNPTVRCEFESGSCFAVGITEVWCWAKDKSGNESKCSFKITVLSKDNVKPTIVCPKDVVVELPCNSSETCVKVTFAVPKATDDCDPNPKVTCSSQSGECFAIGTKEVVCTAEDKSGNKATCSFKITVSSADKTPPVISNCPRDIDLYAECGSTCTNLMARMTPDAKDDCDPNPRIWCEANGKEVNMRSCFMVGKTTVFCYAQDKAGNKSSCSYVVTTKVKDDYVPPVISCPKDLMFSLSNSETKLNKMCRTVDLPGVTARDNCSTPTITLSIYNGTAQVNIDKNFCFMLGKTRVTATARDVAGNTSSCGFWVTIMRFGDKIAAIQDNKTAVAGPKNKIQEGEKNVSIFGETTPTDLNLSTSQKLMRKEFTVYPNPTANAVNLELLQYSGKDVSIQLLNSFGQQVYNTTFKEVTDQAYKVDMQNYPTGMYFIKVTSEGVETSAKKVLKE
jgi:hypothetical protein